MKKIIIFLFLVLSSGFSFAQTNLYGPTFSYQSQSGSWLKLGGYFLHANQNDLVVKVDATANMAYLRDKFVVIPEVGLTLSPSVNSLVLPLFEGELTPYTITPKVGFSILTIVDFSVGYGFDYNTKENLKPIKGFNFSLGINIPINQL